MNAISPKYFNDKTKILCLNSLSGILKALLPENQPHEKIYKSLDSLLCEFTSKNWLISYLIWEIDLINKLGFGFSLDPAKLEDINKKKTVDIKLDNINYKIPSFLVFKNFQNPNKEDIYNGLNFSRNLMENKFFIPNNIRFPYSRKLLEQKFL